MDWNEGYVAGIDYPTSFFREQSPVHLSFSCIINGYEPVALDGPFNYLELGAGQGLTANVLAAANPQGCFHAVDFSRSHVLAARELAKAAELDNLYVLEHSFAELAAGLVNLPPMDFISMHGVYSWVDASNRKHIVDLIARYLKPGGMVYLNYNAMPGWSPSLPLQRLIREGIRIDRHATHEQPGQARQMVAQLQQIGATFFDGNPNLQYWLDSLRNDEGGYLAHEYISDGWTPLYHADVARAMADAKADYIGSGELAQAFPGLYMTQQQRGLLETVSDPMLRETVRDYMTNTSFRQDIYVRGARRMSPVRREYWLRQIGLALTCLPETITLDLDLPIGKIKTDPHFYQPLLDALVRRPHSLTELAEIPALFSLSLEDIGQMAALLTASGQACAYFLGAAEQSVAPAQRLNAVLAEAARFKDHYQVLVSPLLGNGLAAGLVQRLLFRQLRGHAGRLDRDQCVQQMQSILQAQRQPLFKEGRVLETPEEVLGELHSLTEAIVTRRAPIWRTLNML
jgi:hypothetical protein